MQPVQYRLGHDRWARAQGMPMRPQRRRHTCWRIGYLALTPYGAVLGCNRCSTSSTGFANGLHSGGIAQSRHSRRREPISRSQSEFAFGLRCKKSQACVQQVDGFIKQIEESSLESEEKNSLIGSLRWLRDESITKAGQSLARAKL